MTDPRIDVKTYFSNGYRFVRFTDVSNNDWWQLRMDNSLFMVSPFVEHNNKKERSIIRENSFGLSFFSDGEGLTHNMNLVHARRWWDKLQEVGFKATEWDPRRWRI